MEDTFLYIKKDGITQIGEFFIQPSSDDLEVSLLKDAAGVYSPRSYINNAAGIIIITVMNYIVSLDI